MASPGGLDLSGADFVLVGEDDSDEAGFWVSYAGDWDADGDAHPDLFAGAALAGSGTLVAAGILDLSLADWSFVGEDANDYSGLRVAGGGDVDADGLPDLLISATYADSFQGEVYLLLTP
ncbi:MAG: hypothetical protein ABIO70_30585 [Pseudomonadota bacterium]